MQFHCPYCSGIFQIDPSMAGQEVACPLCDGVVGIPSELDWGEASSGPDAAPPIPAPPPAPPSNAFEMSCPLCAGIFQVTADMAGQQVACPHCDGHVTVPWSSSEPAAPPGPPLPSAGAPPPAPVPPPASTQTMPAPTSSQSKDRGKGDESKPKSQTDSSMYPPGYTPPAKPKDSPSTKPKERSKARDQAPQKSAPPPADLLPPAATQTTKDAPTIVTTDKSEPAPSQPTTKETKSSRGTAVDDLLPPGASASSGTAAPEQKASLKRPAVDELLPPGATQSADTDSVQRIDLPRKGATTAAALNRPIAAPGDTFTIPSEDGGVATIHEPVKKIVAGEEERELHTLTPEEKERARMIKNVIVWTVCAFVLAAALFLLTFLSG